MHSGLWVQKVRGLWVLMNKKSFDRCDQSCLLIMVKSVL